MKKALIKYNSGLLALLCSKCRVIIKTGRDFTEEESKYARGEIIIPPMYCKKCNMTIEIKAIPYGKGGKKINTYPTVIEADTWEQACGQLIAAINEDTIDTENNMLISVVTN